MLKPKSGRPFSHLVFIGRFQVFHKEHLKIIEEACRLADKVLIGVGSVNRAPDPRNPFTYDERVTMICESLPLSIPSGQITFFPVCDYVYSDDAWMAGVRKSVNELTRTWTDHPRHIGLIGHAKDATSYYLKLFPEWESVNVEGTSGIGSTAIRNMIYAGAPNWQKYVPVGTADFIEDWMTSEEFDDILDEDRTNKAYRLSWAKAPYPPTIYCADAVVTQSGAILMVTRGERPGKGLLALPGGHVLQEHTARQTAIKELKEETEIADGRGEIPPGRLDSMIATTRVFDDPGRSLRARVITVAHHIPLPNSANRWHVKGADDAAFAQWIPLSDIDPRTVFEDHAAIIDEMLNTNIQTITDLKPIVY